MIGSTHWDQERPPEQHGQPPAAVTRTCRSAGQLQLHLLSRRTRIHCVRCQQDKTAIRVATIGGNWARTVCERCYGSLVHAQRERAKNAEKAKRSPPHTPARTPKLRRRRPLNGLPIIPAIARGKRCEPKHRQSGVECLLAFFRAAGVDAALGRGGRLWINGSPTEPLAHLPTPETAEWMNTVNEIALEYSRDKFIKAVESNARFGDGLCLSLKPGLKGFAIMRGDVLEAIIHPGHAYFPDRPSIHANFLTSGPHWRQVAKVIADAEAEIAAEQERKGAAAAAAAAKEAERKRAPALRCIDHLPDGLAPELIDACLDASRRIRVERQVAYDRPVVLTCDFGQLTLLPITGTETRLHMPFSLTKGTGTLEGELVLGDRDPLPLLIGNDVPDDDATRAWTCALLGFADATCIELPPVEPTPRRRSGKPHRRPPASMSHRSPPTRTVPRRRQWSGHLEPTGHWIHCSGSFVTGHRRHLHDGQTATPEARNRARQVGIILHPHETWVRPYTRGIPEGTEVRFLWHAPPELTLSPT